MPKNAEAPGRKKVGDLIYTKIRQNTISLEGIVNEAVEETFMDALTLALADADDNKKQEMYLLTKDVVLDIVKGGRIQALIRRLSARVVIKEDILDSLENRLSETSLINVRLWQSGLIAYITKPT